MEILIVGGTGVFLDTIISKVKKEGHRVYVLTGEKKIDEERKPKAFQIYQYSYDSEVITEVVQSVNPEVVIFLGAYDTNFTKGLRRHDSVLYEAGLLNVLLAVSQVNRARFIYISNEHVYNPVSTGTIKEEDDTNSTDPWNLTIAAGEDLCLRFKNSTDLNVQVIRLDHVYSIPKRLSDITEELGAMCIDGINDGKIVASKYHRFSMMYVDDAAEYIMQVVKNTFKWTLYNITTDDSIDSLSLANMVKTVFDEQGEPLEVIQSEDDNLGTEMDRQDTLILNSENIRQELTYKTFHTVEKEVPKVVRYMIRHKGEYKKVDSTEKEGFWAKAVKLFYILLPYIENFICFVPFFMLNNRTVGSSFFERVDFYLLYVLLFAVVYGQQQATLSGILATLGYIFRQAYTRSGFDIMLDYNTYVWIAQLFIVGLVVGYMRDRLTTLESERRHEVNFLNYQLADVQGINDSNVQMKTVLENQIVSQADSLGKLFEITSALESFAPEEVLFYAAEMVSKIVETNDVAIYRVGPNSHFARLFSSTSLEARKLGNSIDIQNLNSLTDALEHKRVYINRSLEENMPLMASAVYGETQIEMIIMIWGIPWERMTLGQANMLTIMGSLIQNSVVRANKYLDALEEQRHIDDTLILEQNAFRSLVNAYMNAKNKGLTQCTFVKVDLGGKEDIESIKVAGAAIQSLVRKKVDQMGQMDDKTLYVLLANTDEESAEKYVLGRFGEAGYPGTIIREIA